MKMNFKSFCTIAGSLLLLAPLTVRSAEESPCNRHYESAIKFTVDTPEVHPFSVSATGKVIFSSGNLQYCPKYERIIQLPGGGQRKETVKDFFRFAPRQIDRCTDGADWANTAKDSIASWGNVYYDSVIAEGKSLLDPTADSFRTVKRKCTSCNNAALGYPKGPNSEYKGWMDLFTWGSSCQGQRAKDPNTAYFYPYQQNTIDYGAPNTYRTGPSYYASAAAGNPDGWKTDVKRNNIDTNSGPSRYFDWGYVNVICEYKDRIETVDGTPIHVIDSTSHRPGVWRTLTADEWKYLLTTRKVDGQDSAWTTCAIEDPTNHHYIGGVLLYPDNFPFKEKGINKLPFAYKGGVGAGVTNRRISYLDWTNLYEANGCAFLPAAQWRDNDGALAWPDEALVSFYWSASANDANNGWNAGWEWWSTDANFYPGTDNNNRNYGLSVRLVQDL